MYEVLNTLSIEKLEEFVNREENPVLYLSIDPGKTNGICGYDAKYYLQFMVSVDAADVNNFLNKFRKIDKCVIEDYRIYSGKQNQHVNSDVLTLRVIGRVEHWTEDNGIQLVKQPATIKTTGYKWIGKKPLPKSNPKNHSLDAHVHFMYWAVLNKLIDPADLLRRSKAEN